MFKIPERRKLSSGADTILSRSSYKSQKTPKSNSISRKLELEFNKAFFGSSERRRNKSIDQKEITSSTSSSAAGSDTEDESHIDIMLKQSRRDLENTQALKIRRHLLHAEDYVSVIKGIVQRFILNRKLISAVKSIFIDHLNL